MRLQVLEDYEEMSVKAASIVASQVTLKPNSNLGLATGSTPLGMYNNLIRMYKKNLINFEEVVTFNLDEYVGLPADHPQSYHYYMFDNFFDKVNIPPEKIYIPSGVGDNLKQICKKYDQSINSHGGIDLQVLGIGKNGHIGFNEPDNKLRTNTHVVKLTEETINDNSRFFDSIDDVPKKAISMGMSSIMKSKKILLLASGEQKAEAIKKAINGEITTEHPASLLQLHSDVTILVDKDAAKLLNG
ncbi:glucosamine-6-phosphate deaminase [Sporohalobacter salinus]|uniref:glucosamine-6-phosphate deaminase n=1 Tax=Sporohalobacter salinus TaxID=1494606 RepID=UPI00195FA611|nr:glucosamine-6-phosphate deaminase [Sporohalobacter salinus]MBM7622706.1 glucosamine-6-phosphate deaminase [Sporohalobacter salinus]